MYPKIRTATMLLMVTSAYKERVNRNLAVIYWAMVFDADLVLQLA